MQLSGDEKRAIASLHRLAKRWPKTLWLFSASGTLWVMRAGPKGEHVMDGEGADQSYCIAELDIENDGGDW